MLGHVVKRKRIDNFKYQSLRNVIKKHGVDVIENFDKKFKEMNVEGNRKSVAGVLNTEPSHNDTHEAYETKYTESELKALYKGTESQA